VSPREEVRADLLTDMGAVGAIAGEWRALPAPAAAPCPTSGPEFLALWLATLGRDASPRVVAARRGGRLVGVVPLVAQTLRARDGGRQVSLAGSRRPPMTDVADVRVAPGEELAVARATARLLQASAASWDTLNIGPAAAGSRTFAGLMAFAERYGWTSVTRARTAMVVDTTGPWEAYRERLPRGLRTLPRRLRRLQRMGDLRVEPGLTGAAGGEALGRLMQVYRARWGRGNWLDDPAYRDFLERFRAALGPGARVAGLWLDGAPLAQLLVLREDDRDQVLMLAVDPEHPARHETPGTLLEYLVIERAFADATREVHLLHTVSREKLALSTHVVGELTWIALSPRARAGPSLALPAVEAAITGAGVARGRRRG
jgi:hypothetical protein